MKTVLRLQELDLRIDRHKQREKEIPKQKNKFEVQRQRLQDEVKEREDELKALQVEQHTCETDIDQLQAHIVKYEQQLMAVKKNEEYQALLHEIDSIKKQIAQKEERILSLMIELDEARARLDADRSRVQDELKSIDDECKAIDKELEEAVAERKELEGVRKSAYDEVDPGLRSKYDRIRKTHKQSAAVVPLRGESCSGCNMGIRPQLVNEILAGEIRACNHCGRLLYDSSVVNGANVDASA